MSNTLDLNIFFNGIFFGEARNTKPRLGRPPPPKWHCTTIPLPPLLFSGIEVYTRVLPWHWGNVLHHALATTIRALRGRLPPWQWVANEDYQSLSQSRRQVNCWEQVVVVAY